MRCHDWTPWLCIMCVQLMVVSGQHSLTRVRVRRGTAVKGRDSMTWSFSKVSRQKGYRRSLGASWVASGSWSVKVVLLMHPVTLRMITSRFETSWYMHVLTFLARGCTIGSPLTKPPFSCHGLRAWYRHKQITTSCLIVTAATCLSQHSWTRSSCTGFRREAGITRCIFTLSKIQPLALPTLTITFTCRRG